MWHHLAVPTRKLVVVVEVEAVVGAVVVHCSRLHRPLLRHRRAPVLGHTRHCLVHMDSNPAEHSSNTTQGSIASGHHTRSRNRRGSSHLNSQADVHSALPRQCDPLPAALRDFERLLYTLLPPLHQSPLSTHHRNLLHHQRHCSVH